MSNQTSSPAESRKGAGGKQPRRNELVSPSEIGPNKGPTYDQIARRAYELYAQRGYQHGHDVEDWLQAERELTLGRY